MRLFAAVAYTGGAGGAPRRKQRVLAVSGLLFDRKNRAYRKRTPWRIIPMSNCRQGDMVSDETER